MSKAKVYQPPLTITPKILTLLTQISESLGRYSERQSKAQALRLRRANQIRTIQGSLAIEGNSLSIEQITAVLEGKPVIAPPREVQEVKNALAVYEHFEQFDPLKEQDLLAAHKVLMAGLAIARSAKLTDCAPFVEFMLKAIYAAFTQGLTQEDKGENLGIKLGNNLGKELSDTQQSILNLLASDAKATVVEMAEELKVSTTTIENNLKKLRELGLIARIGGRKHGIWQVNNG